MIAVLLGIFVVPVMGGTISQTESFSGVPTLNDSLVFDKFDPTLGTLDSVEIIISLVSEGGFLIMDNDSQDPASGTFDFGANALFTSTAPFVNDVFGSVVSTLSAAHSGVVNLDPQVGDGTNDFDPAGPDGTSFTGGIENDGDSGFLASAIFGSWTGTGETVTIDVEATQLANISATGGVEIAYTPITTSGDVTVKYTYTVPEPMTMSLLALGGIAVLRRKHKA